MNKQDIIINLSETEHIVELFNSKYNHNDETKQISDNFIREINILKNNISKFTEEYIMTEQVQQKIKNLLSTLNLMSQKIINMYKQTNNI